MRSSLMKTIFKSFYEIFLREESLLIWQIMESRERDDIQFLRDDGRVFARRIIRNKNFTSVLLYRDRH